MKKLTGKHSILTNVLERMAFHLNIIDSVNFVIGLFPVALKAMRVSTRWINIVHDEGLIHASIASVLLSDRNCWLTVRASFEW